MSNRNYYVFCEDDCKFPAMTKSEIEAAILSAFTDGVVTTRDAAAGIIETNHNKFIKLWVGTQAEYNAITETENDVLYIISDDNSVGEIIDTLDRLVSESSALGDALAAAVTRTDGIEDDVDDLEDDVSDLSDTVTALSGSVDTLEDDIDALEEDAEDLSDAVDTTTAFVNAIKGKAAITLYSGTTTFDVAKSFVLSQNSNNYSRIEIVTKRIESSQQGDQSRYNGTTVIPAYEGGETAASENTFVLNEGYIEDNVYTEQHTQWKLYGTTLQLLNIHYPSATDQVELTVKGIA